MKKETDNSRQKTAIIILAISTLVLAVLCGYLMSRGNGGECISNNNNTNTMNNTETNKSSNEIPSNPVVTNNGHYKLGETFVFDGLQLTLDTTYSFTKVSNRYSDHNGKSVIKLGVTVKNVGTEKNHLNRFYYDMFGSQGIQLDSVSSYFDNAVSDAGDLKPGASYKAYFYILYDGDGKYSIDFDNYSEEKTVEFDIKNGSSI